MVDLEGYWSRHSKTLQQFACVTTGHATIVRQKFQVANLKHET